MFYELNNFSSFFQLMAAFYVALTGFDPILTRFLGYVSRDYDNADKDSSLSYIAIMQYYKGKINEVEIGSHINDNLDKTKKKLLGLNNVYSTKLPCLRDLFLTNGLYLLVLLIIMGVESSIFDFWYFPVIMINFGTLVFFAILFARSFSTHVEKRLKVIHILIFLISIILLYHISLIIYEYSSVAKGFYLHNQTIIQKTSVLSSLLLSGFAYLLLFIKFSIDKIRIYSISRNLKNPSKLLKNAADSYIMKNFKAVITELNNKK